MKCCKKNITIGRDERWRKETKIFDVGPGSCN